MLSLALQELASAGAADVRAAVEHLRRLEDPGSFLAAIHALVGHLLPARNFAVLLKDDARAAVRHAYFVDEREAVPSRGNGRTLADYVMRTGRPLLACADTFKALVAAGEVDPIEEALAGWIGAPLSLGDGAFGVLAVRSYSWEDGLAQEHLDTLCVVGRTISDVVARRWAADQLRESEDRFERLAETAPCAIFIFDGERIRYVNDGARLMTAFDRDDLLRRSFWDLVQADCREAAQNRIAACVAGKPGPRRFELAIVPKDGVERWLDLSASVIEFRGEQAVLAVGLDVTDRRRAQAQMRTLAYFDSLTRLPNRVLLEDRAQVALANALRRQDALAVMFVDLDHFKDVNDSLGHSAGDAVLSEFARRLIRAVRAEDTVARLGGDEFVVLVNGLAGPDDAAAIAAKILDTVEAPVHAAGQDILVQPSIGIALYPEDGTDFAALLKNAEAAMYRAKANGRGTYQLFTAALNAAALTRLSLISEMRQALECHQVAPYFQPILDLLNGRLYGFEAVVRWQHPHRGLLLPRQFLAAIDRSPLMGPLEERVRRSAAEALSRWRQAYDPRLVMAVNVGARELQDLALVDRIASVIAECRLPASAIELEITETQAMQDTAATTRVLSALKDLGVGISIDDFGTGYSSLSYLKDLPIDTLKIDRSFVEHVAEGGQHAAVAQAIVTLGHNLGLTVLAEGVESAEQLAILRDMGCDRMQGFLFSEALPAAACADFLALCGGPSDPLARLGRRS